MMNNAGGRMRPPPLNISRGLQRSNPSRILRLIGLIWGATLAVEMMTARIATRLVLVIATIGTISCDRITKHVAVNTLAGASSQSFLADTFRLEYAENAGAFLSLGAAWPNRTRIAVFGVGNGLLLCALVTVAVRRRWPRPALLGVALFAAGGASNLLDRVLYGSVIDFMNVGIGPLRTGIFNVADMAVMLGAAIVMSAGYRLDSQVE
jgi:signal peptidase II